MDEGASHREAKRVPVDFAADLEHGGVRHPVRVQDLSAGGALVECLDGDRPEPGTAAMLALALDAHCLQLLARVARRVDERRVGLAFEALDGACDRALARYVQERERAFLKERPHLAD